MPSEFLWGKGGMLTDEEYWPLHKRVEELLHTLVTIHKQSPQRGSPEFHVYRGASEQCDWLEHPAIQKHKHRVPTQLEDVGILYTRKLVEMVGNRRDDKTFDLTRAGVEFHDEHCRRESH